MIHNGVTTVEVRVDTVWILSRSSKPSTYQNMANQLAQSEHFWPIPSPSNIKPIVLPMCEVSSKNITACREWIVAADVYCDRGAFTLEESIAILEAAKDMGLGPGPCRTGIPHWYCCNRR